MHRPSPEDIQSLFKDAPDELQQLKGEKVLLSGKAASLFDKARAESFDEYNKTLGQNNRERRKYAAYIFWFTCWWTVFIFIILFCQGFGDNSPFCFHLPEAVLITLITTTTVNFLGFFLLVTKYLFNSKIHYPLDKIG